jgi:hypothetical protein
MLSLVRYVKAPLGLVPRFPSFRAVGFTDFFLPPLPLFVLSSWCNQRPSLQSAMQSAIHEWADRSMV